DLPPGHPSTSLARRRPSHPKDNTFEPDARARDGTPVPRLRVGLNVWRRSGSAAATGRARAALFGVPRARCSRARTRPEIHHSRRERLRYDRPQLRVPRRVEEDEPLTMISIARRGLAVGAKHAMIYRRPLA